MIKYMLDTNIVIYIIKRKPVEVLGTFNKHAGQLCISTITMAELHHGAEKSDRVEQNLMVIEDFISRLEVLDYQSSASAHYGSVGAELERAGNTIGVNDLHIAGHARSEGLILVTNNEREFKRVPGLRIENWVGS